MSRGIARVWTMLGMAASVALACASGARNTHDNTESMRHAADDLLRQDRAHSAAAAARNVVDGLSAMFDDSVAMYGSPAGRSRTATEATATLRTNPVNLTGRVAWTPIKVGVSSDGRHGYTQGYIATHKPDGDSIPGKYLAYWVRRASGWKVLVYKRAPRPLGPVSLAMLAPSLPTPGLAIGDATIVERHARELSAAEAAFSAEAGVIGTPNAFKKWGAPDAVNLGYGPEWVQGPEAIGSAQPAPDGRKISWSADTVIVAATGDLGVTMGFISVVPAPSAADQTPRRVPFFTIWKRAGPGAPWRYVAE